MVDTLEKKEKNSPTTMDRAFEEYSLKVLKGEAESEDKTEYERLLSVRTRSLVKLPSARVLGATRWLKSAG